MAQFKHTFLIKFLKKLWIFFVRKIGFLCKIQILFAQIWI